MSSNDSFYKGRESIVSLAMGHLNIGKQLSTVKEDAESGADQSLGKTEIESRPMGKYEKAK